MNRCDALWLYDETGPDVVIKGSYVDFGEDEAGLETGEFTDSQGRQVKPSHWAVILEGEIIPPPPPQP